MQHYARLYQLKRRFQSRKGQKYYCDYMNFMKKLLDSGYAERVLEIPELERTTTDQARTKCNVWCIPHHGVYHPKNPDKIRVVFDCAAEYEGESLNKHLLQFKAPT